MKNINNSKQMASRTLRGKHLRQLAVAPPARRIKPHAVAIHKLGRRILKKLRAVEDSVEIIAREIARKLRSKR